MKKNLLIAIAAAAVACIACNKTEVATVESDAPITVGVYNGVMTKAPISGTTMPTSRQIIFSTYYNAVEGTSANYFQNILFTYSTGTIWTTKKYWPLTGTLDFLGYTMDNNSRVSGVSWGTNTAASVTMTLADNNANQDDLLVGGASALTAASNAVVFKHAQALLTFNAKCSVAYNATTNLGITINDIKVNSSYHAGTVACTRTGGNIAFAWSNYSAQSNKSLPGMTATNLTTTMSAIGGTPGLMLPGQPQTSITIYYTIHNGKDSGGNNVNNNLQYTFPAPSPSKTWDPGKKYVYNIDMTLTEITISATVTDWATQTGQAVPIPA